MASRVRPQQRRPRGLHPAVDDFTARLAGNVDDLVKLVQNMNLRQQHSLTSEQLSQAVQCLSLFTLSKVEFCELLVAPPKVNYLARHAWERPQARAALVQLLAMALRQLDAALGGDHGTSSSGSSSAVRKPSRRDVAQYSNCILRLCDLFVCVQINHAHQEESPYVRHVVELLLHTDTLPALSRLLASATAALREERLTTTDVVLAGVSLLNGILYTALCAAMDLLPSGSAQSILNRAGAQESKNTSSGNTSSTTATSGPAVDPPRSTRPSKRKVLVGLAVQAALADSGALEHCCRAALAGDRSAKVLQAVSKSFSGLGQLAAMLQLHRPQPHGGRAALRARDAILSGPCVQYILAADVLSQLRHADGGPLYGMPVRHLLPRTPDGCDVMDSLYLLHLVCVAVPGPMRTHRELRHVPLMVARACMRQLQLVLVPEAGEEVDEEQRKKLPRLGMNVLREAGELLHAMRLGPVEYSAGSMAAQSALTGPRVGATVGLGNSGSSSRGGNGGGVSSGGDAGGDGGGGQGSSAAAEGEAGVGGGERSWVPGRWLGRQLLEDWWDVAVPLIHAVLDVGLRMPDGMQWYKMDGNSSSEDADKQASLDIMALQMSLRMTPLDKVPNGLPLAPSPPPNIAAALVAGFVPCLERLMRAAQRGAQLAERVQPLLVAVGRTPLLYHVFGYGDERQLAALVVTAGKLLGRMGGATVAAFLEAEEDEEEEDEAEGEEGRELLWVRSSQCMAWLLSVVVDALLLPDLLPDTFPGQQKRVQQQQGQEQGQAVADQADGGGSSSSSGSGSAPVSGVVFLPSAHGAARQALPPPARQALRLLSLALVRWTAACLHAREWVVQPHEPSHAPWNAALVEDALGVLEPMQLMCWARIAAMARGDTRAADSWHRVLVRDMGLPGSLEPLLHVLARADRSMAARRGACTTAAGVLLLMPSALPDEWRAAVVPEPAKGLAGPLWAMVDSVMGPTGPHTDEATAEVLDGVLRALRMQTLAGLKGQGEVCRLQMDVADRRMVRAGELLPPPCEAGALLPLCANPRCGRLEGDSEVGVVLQACAGCKRVAYCCRACQVAHWKEGGHKQECRGKGA